MAFGICVAPSALFLELVPVRHGNVITRAMNNADNHDFRLQDTIIESVLSLKNYPQVRRQPRARGAGKWRMTQALESPLDHLDEAARRFLGCFRGNIRPNLGEILFSAVG